MVVEDDEDIRRSLTELLEDEGYSVLVAQDGARALEVLEKGARPCLMLVDLLMPVMDGVELIQRLRGSQELAKIPVVVVSAASAIAPPEGMRILRKPVGCEDVLREVERYC
ncbi:MAG: response regulator [Minicystis sp.]